MAAANALSFTCRGVDQTHRLARALAGWVRVGDVVLLSGDLGAGKTTFMKGVAEGLGVSDAVTSPTFALAHQYSASGGELPSPTELLHIDLYRLDDPCEMLDYIWEELPAMAVFVEWGDRLAAEFPDNRLEIAIDFVAVSLAPDAPAPEAHAPGTTTAATPAPDNPNPDTRTIKLTGVGPRWQEAWPALSANLSASLSAALQ